LEVGLLAGKVRTIEGQEVTIPNSVLVGTATKNYLVLAPQKDSALCLSCHIK
jgi:small-conductance mechanosensitive channel